MFSCVEPEKSCIVAGPGRQVFSRPASLINHVPCNIIYFFANVQIMLCYSPNTAISFVSLDLNVFHSVNRIYAIMFKDY